MFIGAENAIFQSKKKFWPFLIKCISEILIRKIIIERKKPMKSEKQETKSDYLFYIEIAN